MFRYLFISIGFLFNIIILGSFTLCLIIYLLFQYYSDNLPTAEEIENYKPATLSRVYNADGNISGIFGNKNRIYTPIEDIPQLVKNAFISAEDKNFYKHFGYDPIGLLKAISDVLRGKKLRGASTITQQVMKNFLLSSERTGKRKIKEIILASRIEKVLTKDQILNVYLNEIYLGLGAYGVTAAAITYFDKKLDELSIGEASFLAALPKAPSFYHPIRQKKKSIQRRNFVIKELNENGFISLLEAEEFIKSDLVTALKLPPSNKELTLKKNASYFNDEIYKSILLKYDRKVLETNGLTIRSTLNDLLQSSAQTALQDELIKFDENLGIYRGPIINVLEKNVDLRKISKSVLLDLQFNSPVNNWFFALVSKVTAMSAEITVRRNDDKFENTLLHFKERNWIKKRQVFDQKTLSIENMTDLLSAGDIILVSWESNPDENQGFWSLRQIPEIQGAFMVMEPNSGKILAMQGGFSYELSSFNRAVRANRQPGSLFKPFVYLTALENGYKPNSIIVDAPISLKQVTGVWRPQNASDKWFGVAPLRKGLEHSRNLMTVRLAKEVGMDKVKKNAELFGLYKDMPTLLSYSLGAGETTLLKLIKSYSILANGGFQVEPTFFDLVQDRFGETIYKHGFLRCLGCNNNIFDQPRKPIFLNTAKRLIDPVSIFQVNSILKGVVERGTAAKTVGTLGQPIAGKTGTTNKSKDVWFVGYTPNFVAGCYIGYDIPRSLGKNASGGSICGSAFKTFFESAYKSAILTTWKAPQGVQSKMINYDTGQLVNQTNGKSINEYFRDGQPNTNFNLTTAIDGGFGMGHDLLFLNESLDEDKVGNSFLSDSLGAIFTGEKY